MTPSVHVWVDTGPCSTGPRALSSSKWEAVSLGTGASPGRVRDGGGHPEAARLLVAPLITHVCTHAHTCPHVHGLPLSAHWSSGEHRGSPVWASVGGSRVRLRGSTRAPSLHKLRRAQMVGGEGGSESIFCSSMAQIKFISI